MKNFDLGLSSCLATNVVCHGSKFDLAGRVYKGVPASANLEIPPYSYESESVLVIGVDAEVA